MKNTTIAITAQTKKDLDAIREQLSYYFDIKVSYSFVIKHILEKNNVEYYGKSLYAK